MVGYIDQKIEKSDDYVNVYVSRGDLITSKCGIEDSRVGAGSDSEDDPTQRKYWNERNIQATLNLESWMYTLSNPS